MQIIQAELMLEILEEQELVSQIDILRECEFLFEEIGDVDHLLKAILI